MSGPLPGSRAGRGARHTNENELHYEVNYMSRKKTSLSAVLFHKNSRACGSKAAYWACFLACKYCRHTCQSASIYYIAWLCGFCVGTLSAYIEGATGIDSDSDSDDV
eukprot:2848374-Amphidinium_carterae.1